jgi:hypothetical protein
MAMRKNGMKSGSKSYDVGYGRPPKEFRFNKGRSGNPAGTSRKPPSLAADLKVSLERALNTKVKRRRGKKDDIVTKGTAGIDMLVSQYADGDRHARRDVFTLAATLGVDLTAGQNRTIEHVVTEALAAEDEAIIKDFLRRHGVELNQGAANVNSVFDQADPDSPDQSKENSHDDASHS